MEGKISHSGLLARSPEGHAAHGMQIKGNEDLWVEIQANTFRNWVNEHLPAEQKVADLSTDLSTGVRLCILVEALQGRQMRPGYTKKPTNHHQYLENVTQALNSIEKDGVKLVNIGNVDIVNGNLKLILGLIWSLIVRYQIGRSKFPPRKLMLAWLQAVLPECKVHNLTTDWNSGVLLSALVDYCKPGLCPYWKTLDKRRGVENCRDAMDLAQNELGIPAVLEPEYLASPWLDELSGMTYLSYFLKAKSPGYHATLRWINSRLKNKVANFTTDWNDGRALSELVRSLGGNAQAPEKLSTDPHRWEANLKQAMYAAEKLGAHPVLAPRDMADRNVEHLAVMAYVAQFQWIPERPPVQNYVKLHLESTSARVGEPVYFSIELLDSEFSYKKLTAGYRTPDHKHLPCNLKRGDGSFTPHKIGMYEIVLSYDGEELPNTYHIRVVPQLVHTAPPGMAPCALGSLVQVIVNATGAPKKEDILVTAYSPHTRPLRCPLQTVDGMNCATFKPDEVGEWRIEITYQGRQIQGGPFTCHVFDTRGIEVTGFDGAIPMLPHSLEVDTSAAGIVGEVFADVVHDKRSVHVRVERVNDHKYRLHFTPKEGGKHRVYVYFNGYDVKGSPFMMRVGTQRGKKSSSSSPSSHVYRQSPVSTRHMTSSSPSFTYQRDSPSLEKRSFESSSFSKSFDNRSPSFFDQTDFDKSFEKSFDKSFDKSERHITSPSLYDNRPLSPGYSSYKKIVREEDRSDSPGYSSFRKIVKEEGPGSIHGSGSPFTSYKKIIQEEDRPGSPGYSSYKKIVREEKHTSYDRSPVFTRDDYFQNRDTDIYDYARMTNDDKVGTDVKKIIKEKHTTYNRSPVVSENGYNLRNNSSEIYDFTKKFDTDVNFNEKHASLDRYSPATSKKETVYKTSYSKISNGKDSPVITETKIIETHSPTHNDSRIIVKTSPMNGRKTPEFQGFSDNFIDEKLTAMREQAKSPEMMDYIDKNMFQTKVEREVKESKKYSRYETETHDRSPIPTRYMVEDLSNASKNSIDRKLKSSDSIDRKLEFSKKSPKSHAIKGVKVKSVSEGFVGHPVEFEIDGSNAGAGDLEILVEGGRVTSAVKSLGGQRFKALFTPHKAMQHRIDIRFNGETVPGSPWYVNIMTPPSLSVMGDSTRLVPANTPALFEIITNNASLSSDDLTVNVFSPTKRLVTARVFAGINSGVHSVEFLPTEVGTHIVEVAIGGEKLAAGPLIAKVYDAELIQVTDVSNGVVGQPVQFRVDASQAGEGQLEISINEGEVPNHVQVVGGGRCLVSFTPEHPKPHLIDIKFNGETVRGCPFVCNIADTSRVSVNLTNLELVPINQPSTFHMNVGGGGAAELAVAVRGPVGELPVKVTGDIHSGFNAEFTPTQVGAHQITVDYNGRPIPGTPFIAKAFDASRVTVGSVSKGTVGRPVTFTVDASEAGEGNLEITISARGLNIPTQVHPQGNARFAVSFVPAEACDHIINVAFNKRPVDGCPLIVNISGGNGGPSVTLPGPGSVHKTATLLVNHTGKLEDIEVNVEGPGGQAVPTQVQPLPNGAGFRAEFVPRVVGEHRISVSVLDTPAPGSPYSAKIYDVNAIKVKESAFGVVGKPVTFLVETSQAGPGNLEVTVNGGRVPTSAQAQGPHTYAISFTPREATAHTVDLRFNGQDVPGSPFVCNISPVARIIGADVLDKISVGHNCLFAVECPSAPVVEILGPARRPVAAKVTPQSTASGKFNVEFTPSEVGDHSVEVRLPGGHIEGSPFLVKAYDANRVSVTDITDGIVGKAVSFNINASQAGAGNLEIIVAVNGKNVPNFVQSEGNARFRVNFKPSEAAAHSLSVRFNGQPVPGSPFSCKVSGNATQQRVPISGNGVELAALGLPAEIVLENVSAADVKTTVTSPNGTTLRHATRSNGDNTIVTFTPTAVGRHLVAILVNDHAIVGSPFCCNVYDVTKVYVSGLYTNLTKNMADLSLKADNKNTVSVVGKPVTFSVDAAQAGEGTLELVVSTKQSTIKAEVVACARGLYDVTFVPQTAEMHFVNITFNDTPVVGSPFECPVIEAVQHVQIGSNIQIEALSDTSRIEIIDGNNKKIAASKLGKSLEFVPSAVGTYRLTIHENHEPIVTKTIHAFDASKIEVISAPEAVCHRPAVVGISLKHCGPGTLTASVKIANKNVPHSVRQSPNNPKLWEVIFHPENAAPHKIMLFYNNIPKQGVLEVPVRAPGNEPWAGGLGLFQSQVGRSTTFTIDTLGKPAREFDVVVSGPSGSALPVRCYQTRTGKLQAEWTATSSGAHQIEVLHQSKHLNGSPFVCHAFVPDRARVLDPPTQILPGEQVIFTINTKEAGVAELDVSVTNPVNQAVPVKTVSLDEYLHEISFVTSVSGVYTVTVSHGGLPLSQSPFTITAGALPPQPPARAVGSGLESAQVGETASFTVNGAVQPVVKIEAVEGTINPHIKCVKSGEYLVTYIPLWVGTYDIIITCANKTLAGSPYRPTVVDTTAVRVIGGWQQYLDADNRLKLPCKIALDTTNAGPGAVQCVIGERKVAVDTNGTRVRLDLSAEGLQSGEHDFLLTFGNIALADAPKKTVSSGDQVILTGRGLAQAQCDEITTFTIDGSRANNGTPEATLHNAETSIPVPVALVPSGDMIWRGQYTVTTPGSYLLSVLWAGRPVKGCPLMIEAKGGADSSKVICSGEGLRHGVVGREIRSWIDTRRAGPGELTAHCAGPRKVAYCELYDHGDATFTLNVKPQESGRHLLTIKYAARHVPGSPFTLKVAGAPDASKVRVYGPGIEHGVLATFQSRFICDTRGAGAGQLTVRVRGPKGAFRVEMQRESQKDRTILCKYDPTEPGDYRVEVKWAGDHVPGSPFPVMIFDTQEELRRYISSL